MCSGTFFPGLKRPDYEAEYSAPSSAEVKNTRSFTSILPQVDGWWLIKQRDNFAFLVPMKFSIAVTHVAYIHELLILDVVSTVPVDVFCGVTQLPRVVLKPGYGSFFPDRFSFVIIFICHSC
jgi:hypothetical protein